MPSNQIKFNSKINKMKEIQISEIDNTSSDLDNLTLLPLCVNAREIR